MKSLKLLRSLAIKKMKVEYKSVIQQCKVWVLTVFYSALPVSWFCC